jgi:hypothetical protein
MISHICARCGERKPVREFYPSTIDGILVRTDVCAGCAPVLAQLRKASPMEAWLWPFIQREREEKRKQ